MVTHTVTTFVEYETEADSPEAAKAEAGYHGANCMDADIAPWTGDLDVEELNRTKYLKDNLTAIEDVWLAPDSKNL